MDMHSWHVDQECVPLYVMGHEVWWPRCGCLLCLNEIVHWLVFLGSTKVLVLIRLLCWLCHWRNVGCSFFCRWCGMQYPGPFLWGYNQEMFFWLVIQGRCQCAWSARWRVVNLFVFWYHSLNVLDTSHITQCVRKTVIAYYIHDW
jgi:hypothetical protein